MDYQCELIFGPSSRICPYMPACKRLWCTISSSNEGCKTQHMPWADGTPCGKDNGFQCQKGKCINIYELEVKNDIIDVNYINILIIVVSSNQ